MRATLYFLTCVMFAALIMAGCVVEQPSTAPAPQVAAGTAVPEEETAELIPVRIGSIAGASQSYIPILLQEHGIGEKYGFAVEITPLTSTGQQWTGMRAGEFDVSSGSVLDLLRQREGGLEARAIRGFSRFNNPIVALADAPYESIEDLAGLRVGTPSTALLDWMIVRAVGVTAHGIDLEIDAEAVNASPPLISELLGQGELDAAFHFKTFTIDPVAEGTLKEITTIPQLMSEGGYDPDAFYLTYNLTEDWRQQHPEAVPLLVAAMDEAVEVLMTDDLVWPELAAVSGVEGEEQVVRFRDAMRESFATTFDVDKVAATQALLDSLVAVVGDEIIGATVVDPEAFDFASYEAAQELRR